MQVQDILIRLCNFLTVGSTGPLFDEDGQVLTHTILGSWEDFQQEAITRGDIEVNACLFNDHFWVN